MSPLAGCALQSCGLQNLRFSGRFSSGYKSARRHAASLDTVCYGLLDPEDEGCTVLRNVEDYSSNDTASNPSRIKSRSHVTQGYTQWLFWTPESYFLNSSFYKGGHRAVFTHTHTNTHIYICVCVCIYKQGARGGVVVKVLSYKPAGRGFDSRRCRWNFQWHNSSGRTMAWGRLSL
jgi:hypothetical protein